MHTLWVREHNRIVNGFAAQNAQQRFGWSCEEVYQRARRIVVAQFQNIVYDQFLPIVLGQSTMDAYGLRLPPISSGPGGRLM
jgi:peroxidase